MSAIIAGLVSSLFYLAGATVQGLSITREISGKRLWVLASGAAAVLLHGVNVYLTIYTDAGINMSFFAMGSLIALVMAATILLSSMRKAVANLFIMLFPLAAVVIWLSIAISGSYTPRTDLGPEIMTHILISVVAYSILTIAAFQAILLAYLNRQLRHRGSISLMKALPPLQTMESLLFELLWAGLVFLSVSIITGFLFLEDLLGQHVAQHTVITMASWFVFAILLWGRHRLGWRGNTAIRWTLSGFALLAVGYFGSKLVLEFILHRV